MKTVHFEIPKPIDAFDLVTALRMFFGRFQEAAEKFPRQYLDTFDWRLYAKNQLLEVIALPSSHQLALGPIEPCGEAVALNVESSPSFVWDLPEGYLRSRLEAIIQNRALLPQLRLQCRRTLLNQQNQDSKTILRIQLEKNNLTLPDGTIKILKTRLNVIAIKGYSKPCDKALEFLDQNFHLKPGRRTILKEGLSALGRHPMDYSSKLDIQLDSQMRSDAAAKIILRQLYGAMKSNEAGVLQKTDSEFLHDYRVAIRRSRSALSQLKKMFPQEILNKAISELSWLSQSTGPARDLDVYLLKFNEYKQSLPISVREDLEPMREYLLAEHAKAHNDLIGSLSTKRYEIFMKWWKAFLESPLPEKPAKKSAIIPIHALANRRIWMLYKKLLRDGRSINGNSPADKFHELRKACKKLRYLLEFFQSLYPKKQVREAINILRNLQDNLGDFQDLEVQQGSIKKFSQNMMEAGNTPAKTLLAMGVLTMEMENKSRQTRKEFVDYFADFESPRHQALYKTLFSGERFPTKHKSENFCHI